MRRLEKKFQNRGTYNAESTEVARKLFAQWIADMGVQEDQPTDEHEAVVGAVGGCPAREKAMPRSVVHVQPVRPTWFHSADWGRNFFSLPMKAEGSTQNAILGDSNVARMRDCCLLNTEAFSFSGARFRNIEYILSCSQVYDSVTNGVLYCGTNDVLNDYDMADGLNCLPHALHQMQRVFPNATIQVMGIHLTDKKIRGKYVDRRNVRSVNNALERYARQHLGFVYNQPFPGFEENDEDTIHFSKSGGSAFGQAVQRIVEAFR